MDVPWPKVEKGKAGLTQLIASPNFDIEASFQLMQDKAIVPDSALPDTGISLDWERLLSAMYIEHTGYGTRCTTVILIDTKGTIFFKEQSYKPQSSQTYQFSVVY